MFGDSFYKHEYDRVVNENKLLKQKVEKLEKDKLELKRSLFDLNGRLVVFLAVCCLFYFALAVFPSWCADGGSFTKICLFLPPSSVSLSLPWGRLNRAVQIAGRIVPYDIDGNASSDLPPDASGSGSRVETDIGPTVRVHKNAAGGCLSLFAYLGSYPLVLSFSLFFCFIRLMVFAGQEAEAEAEAEEGHLLLVPGFGGLLTNLWCCFVSWACHVMCSLFRGS